MYMVFTNLQFTGIALAAFVGIFLNLLLPDHQNNGFLWWEKIKLIIKKKKEQRSIKIKQKNKQKEKITQDQKANKNKKLDKEKG